MSKIKEKIKNILPDMKKGVERFPLTILCGIIVFLLSVYVIENSDMKNHNLLSEIHKMLTLIGLSLPLTAALELIREKYLSDKNKCIIRVLNVVITVIFIIFYRFSHDVLPPVQSLSQIHLEYVYLMYRQFVHFESFVMEYH